ncbi:MAG: PDZ domain-containing protein [Planctomycetes bacterium]|nr:PDZ domain-containing protein [Planctomycetota bacterium]
MKYTLAMLLALIFAVPAIFASEVSTDQLEQQAWHVAVESAAKSIVQIRTIGGLDQVGKTLISQGPTTGLIVSTDGYIVSSAFNFAGQPSSILVRLASGKQLPAELVARDKNRLLVLLKIEAETPLPVAEAAITEEIRVGQWSIAVGRTFHDDEVNVSVGIVSGLNRRYGRVIQTDASISVANYGGPLVDVYGRTMGVLVPMAPSGGGSSDGQELAGAEYYDSGIGFAVPISHVMSVLDRWKLGEDLLPGKLGVGLVAGPTAIALPKIAAVWPGSPAAVAGWKTDDLIVSINGQQTQTQSQLRFQIVPLYAGDTVSVTIRRGEEEFESEITLAGEMAAYQQAFLGVLPARQGKTDEKIGILVRNVWPNSPAAEAGLQAGDLLKAINDKELKSFDKVLETMDSLPPDESVKLTISRDEKELTLSAKLGQLPSEILSRDQLASSDGKQEPDSNAELQPLKLPEFAQEAKFYASEGEGELANGLLLWLGDGSEADDQQLLQAWQEICQRDQMILLIAHPASETGWNSEDLAYLDRLASAARRRWQLDSQRVVVGGIEKAGQLAYALAFAKKKDFSGAIGIDAPLPRSLKIPSNRPGSRLAILAVESQDSTFAPLIRNDLERLGKAGYPASWLQTSARDDNRSVLEADLADSLGRWIDGLDRF